MPERNEDYVDAELEQEHNLSIQGDPAMASIVTATPPGQGLVDQLQQLEGAAIIFDRRCQLLETCRISSIRATQPEDWVLSKAKDGTILARLGKSGADVVAQYWGVEIYNIRPLGPREEFQPEEVVTAEGRTLRAWCDARSTITGRTIENIEASRSSTEQFIGRPANYPSGDSWHGDLVASADLRSSVHTLLLTKSTRALAGLSKVPIKQLELAWEGSETKTTDRCAKGSGFGDSKQRTSQKVSKADASNRDELWNEILRRTGGDVDAARSVLKDITANPPKFAGFDQVERLTQDWQIEKAAKALQVHPMFGDDQQGQEEAPATNGNGNGNGQG